MKKDEWAHIDIGNQIDNSWNKDSAIALKFNNVGFSVKIRERDKKVIENRYRKISERDNKRKRKIVVMIYCFLLYKLLVESNGLAKKVRLCRDINPSQDVYRYLRFISKYYGSEPIDEKIKIRFKEKKEGRSRAHRLANDTYKGRKKPNYLIKKKDVNDIINLIEKHVVK